MNIDDSDSSLSAGYAPENKVVEFFKIVGGIIGSLLFIIYFISLLLSTFAPSFWNRFLTRINASYYAGDEKEFYTDTWPPQ